MAPTTYNPGDAVSVDGEGGYTVLKVMKSSLKVEKDGNTSIKPMALCELDGGEAPAEKPASRKRSSKKAAPKGTGVKAKPRRNPVEDAENPPTKSRKRKAPAEKPAASKKSYEKRDSSKDGEVVDKGESTKGTASKPKAARPTKKSEADPVGKVLWDCDTPTKVVNAVKGHKAYKFVNTDSFKKTVAQKNDLQFGLFRMRMGNLLRGAINRASK